MAVRSIPSIVYTEEGSFVTKIKLLHSHIRNYIQAVFADCLLREGFRCVSDDMLSWYRIRGTIVNSLSFFTLLNRIPVELKIAYGIHPLFAPPYFINKAFISNYPLNDETFSIRFITEDVPVNSMNYSPFAEDALVYAPGNAGRGIYTLEGIILPQMDGVTTISDCYLFHKKRYLDYSLRPLEREYLKIHPNISELEIRLKTVSDLFIEEAIYENDSELLPYLQILIDERISAESQILALQPQNTQSIHILHQYKIMANVIANKEISEYRNALDQRLKRNLEIYTLFKSSDNKSE